MTYTPNVPLGPQRISDSQPIIEENFIQLNTQYGTNGDHFEFTAPTNNGHHKQVTLPDRTGTEPTPGANECAIFGVTISTQTYPFLRRDGSTENFPLLPIKSYGIFTGVDTPVLVNVHNISTITSALINVPVIGVTRVYTLTFAEAFPDTDYGVIAEPNVVSITNIKPREKTTTSVELVLTTFDGADHTANLGAEIIFSVFY